MSGEASILRRLVSLEGKRALLTGAGGGIGHALGAALAGAGARVALHARTREKLADLEGQIGREGGRAVVLTAELGDLEAARRLVGEAHAALGGLGILVNCAATNRRKPIAEGPEDDWDWILAVDPKSL